VVYGLSILDLALWYMTIGANVLLFAFLWRKHRTTHPMFTVYIGFCICRSFVLVWVRNYFEPSVYFYTYYIGVACGAMILTLVVIEVAREVLGPYNTIPLRSVINLTGSSLLVVYMAIFIALYLSDSTAFWARLVIVDRFSLLLVVGGLVATVHTSWNLGLPWDKLTKAICAGLLLANTVQAVVSVFSLYGYNARFTRPLHMIAFFIAQCVWIEAGRKDGALRFEADYEFACNLKKQMGTVKERLLRVNGISA
jgi:hypothetical protein